MLEVTCGHLITHIFTCIHMYSQAGRIHNEDSRQSFYWLCKLQLQFQESQVTGIESDAEEECPLFNKEESSGKCKY